MAVTPQTVQHPVQKGAPGQAPATPSAPAPSQQARAFSYQAGSLLLACRPRLRAYGCEIIAGLTLLPVFGLGALVLLSIFLRWCSTKILVYENLVELRTGILFRKTTYVWLFQIEDMWLERPLCNLLTGDATIHLRIGQREAPGGRLSVSPPMADPANGNGTMPKPTEITLFGLGNHKFMKHFCENLREMVLEQRHRFKGIWV